MLYRVEYDAEGIPRMGKSKSQKPFDPSDPDDIDLAWRDTPKEAARVCVGRLANQIDGYERIITRLTYLVDVIKEWQHE